jgi:Zn ribbon nucleic-acid-binding protein
MNCPACDTDSLALVWANLTDKILNPFYRDDRAKGSFRIECINCEFKTGWYRSEKEVKARREEE